MQRTRKWIDIQTCVFRYQVAKAIETLREYRIDVTPDGNQTRVTVRGRQSEVTANDSAFAVYAQQTAIITGGDQATSELQGAAAPDSWDSWCATRDRHEEQAASLRYLSRETVGYEDLDDYGFWRVYPGYGAVWIPTTGVPIGWAPYRYGQWVWIEPWGWTWIDDAPWGFAPFHYGRWAIVGGTWAWIPGRIVARPVYAPALVAFVGGERFRLSLAIGTAVAWFPLGPGEVYLPTYRVSPTYVRQVNITNVNITNFNVTNYNITNVRYVNRTAPGAVTAVSREDFVNAHAIAKTSLTLPPASLAAGQVTSALGVLPSKESVLGHPLDISRPITQPPAAAINRVVIARKTPPSVTAFASHEPGGTAKIGGSTITQTTTTRPTQVKVVSRTKPASPARSDSGKSAMSSQPVKASMSSTTRPNSGASVKSVGPQPRAKKSVVIDERSNKTAATSVNPSKSPTKSSQSTESSSTKSDSKSAVKDKAKKIPEKKETKPPNEKPQPE